MIKSTENIKKIIRKESPYLKDHFGIKRIGLFGSFSSHTANESSDVDLVVEFETPIGFKFITLVEFLENKLGRKV
ncbi:MAG: nucleotidyltransferase, partial [bacterium]|nr:nucleotidyltransferase [bacterium]